MENGVAGDWRLKMALSSLVLVVALGTADQGQAQAPVPTSTHDQAARELCQVIGVKRSIEASAQTMGAAMRQANPELARYQDLLEKWLKETLASFDAEADFAKLYKEVFTEAELRELTAFYRTPIGKKALQKLPELMQKGAQLGVDRFKASYPKLEAMIAARKKE